VLDGFFTSDGQQLSFAAAPAAWGIMDYANGEFFFCGLKQHLVSAGWTIDDAVRPPPHVPPYVKLRLPHDQNFFGSKGVRLRDAGFATSPDGLRRLILSIAAENAGTAERSRGETILVIK